MNEKIRILVVDDHPVVRKGLVAMLQTEADLEVVGECSTGMEAVERAVTLTPDVVLMDLVMPEMDGIEATRLIKQKAPQVNILVLTSFSTNDKVLPSLHAGAIGYILKDSQPTDLLQALRQVAKGEGVLHPGVTRQVIDQFSRSPENDSTVEDLTEREAEVLRYLAQGFTNQEIARILVVSQPTVHTHVSKILAKLNLNSRTQAALYAIKKGLISIDEVS